MSRRRILQGLSASWLRFGVTLLVTFVQMPILYASFPPAELGIYLLFFTASSFLALADIGFGSVIGRGVGYLSGRTAAASETPDESDPLAYYAGFRIPDVVSTGQWGYVAVIAAMLVGGVAIGLFGYFRGHDGSLAGPQLFLAWMAFLCGAGLNLVSYVPFSAMIALGDVGWEEMGRVIILLGRFATVAVLAPLTHSILVLCVAELVINLAQFIFAWALLRARHGRHFVERGRLDLALLRRMAREALPLFWARIGGLTVLEATPLIIGLTSGTAKVPDFVALKQIAYQGITIPKVIPSAIGPFFTHAYAAHDMERVRHLHDLCVRLTMGLAVLWTVGFLVWGHTVMGIWLGPSHYPGFSVVVALGLMALLEAHHETHASLSFGMGRFPFGPWLLGAGALAVGLAFVLGYPFGLAGFAWGNMLAQLVTINWFAPIFTLRLLGVPLRTFLRSVGGRIVLYGGALTGFALLAEHGIRRVWPFGGVVRGMPDASVAALVLGGLGTVALAGVLTWQVILRPNERVLYRSLVVGRLPFLAGLLGRADAAASQ